MDHAIYLVDGRTPLGTIRYYVGCTRVVGGVDAALERRKGMHESGPASGGAVFLSICTDLKIKLLKMVEKENAAGEELASFLELFTELGYQVRGACFQVIKKNGWKIKK